MGGTPARQSCHPHLYLSPRELRTAPAFSPGRIKTAGAPKSSYAIAVAVFCRSCRLRCWYFNRVFCPPVLRAKAGYADDDAEYSALFPVSPTVPTNNAAMNMMTMLLIILV